MGYRASRAAWTKFAFYYAACAIVAFGLVLWAGLGAGCVAFGAGMLCDVLRWRPA